MRHHLDVSPLIDPDVAAGFAAMPVDVGGLVDGLTDDSLPRVRRLIGDLPQPELSGAVERSDHLVDATTGVRVRVHRPVGTEGTMPCLYWMHGGGLVLGSNVGDDARFDRWCRQFGFVGASIEYRLAPEVPYPGPIADCYAGLRWIHANASDLGVDRTSIGIGGASAGGGLAASLALLVRDRGELPLAYQLLIAPMLDDRQITASSAWNDPIWPPSANAYGWAAYLGDAKGGPDVSPYAAAARATDLRDLPPALISVGAIDCFSDEDIDYAVRLRHAGVPVELHVYPGAPHGFDTLDATVPVALSANTDIDRWLAAQLSRCAAAGGETPTGGFSFDARADRGARARS